MSQELLKRQYQSMTKEEEIEFRDKLRNIPSLDDVQLRVSVCDTDYDEIGKFRYAGKTDKSSEVTTVVCLSKNRNFLGSPANVFKSFVK